MNDHIDVEPILDDWFAEGSDILPDRSIEAVLLTVQTTTQRGAWRAPWRTTNVHGPSRLAVLAGATAIVAVIGLGVINWSGDHRPAAIGASASPTSMVDSSPAPTTPAASASTALRSSPAGTIIYRLVTDGSDRGAFAMRLATGQPQPLSDSTCCLVLSPDGSNVMTASGTPLSPSIVTLLGNPVEGAWGAGGSAGTQHIPTGLSLEPHAWGAIAFAFAGRHDSRPDLTGVWLSIDNGGGMYIGDIAQLTISPTGFEDIPLDFARDGTKLLFVRRMIGQTNGDLYVVDVDPTALTSTKTTPRPPVPARLNPDGTAVPVDEYFGPGASWSPDGSQVAFAAVDLTSAQDMATVYTVHPGDGDATALTGPGGWTTSAHWSPDGRWIAFDRDNGMSRHDLILLDPDTGSQTNLTADFEPGVCCARWSPDSRHLLGIATIDRDDQADLYAFQVDASPPIQLTHEPGQYLSYGWSQVP